VAVSAGILVIDVGTTSVRAALVDPDATVSHVRSERLVGTAPSPGVVELDAARLAVQVVELASGVLDAVGPVTGVGVANQRSTTIIWDRLTGEPVAPGIGWQDLRTVITCLVLQADGIRLAPTMSATKIAAILDDVDPSRQRDLCFGTVDTWVAWTLSGGHLHVTDATNAAVTGLVTGPTDGSWDGWSSWDTKVLEALRIPASMLPTIVDSSGHLGEATALKGGPAICSLVGDQQASLFGQGCTRRAMAKATFGTGGMLDLCTGTTPPAAARRGPLGTYPIVASQRDGAPVWGIEAIMLTAGSCVDWLCDDLGLIDNPADSAAVAARCDIAGDTWFVPAFMGLGTPVWDFGARGTLLGVTRGTGRPEIVRAVLEGIAQRGADLLEAAEADSGMSVPSLRIDGGMSANPVFTAALADACGRPIELAPEVEATTRGAGMLAGLAVGMWRDSDEVADAYRPRAVIEPTLDDAGRESRRARWLEARSRSERTLPDLSGIDF
jgi:glycerol kinase